MGARTRALAAIASAAAIAVALTGCARFISHETPGQYNSTEQSGGSFDSSLSTSDPAPYEGTHVGKVHLDPNPGAGAMARGTLNLGGEHTVGTYGGAFYLPPGTLSGPSPTQQRDLDLVRWRSFDDTRYGALRIGSDHRVRLVRGEPGSLDTIGSPFALQEGCWNWVVVHQWLNDNPGLRTSLVYLNGQQVLDSHDPNWFGSGPAAISYGAAAAGTGDQPALDLYLDRTFVALDTQDPIPPPNQNACDPAFGGAQPSAIPTSTQTPLSDATSFLHEGDFPLQHGVSAGTIDDQRAAVLTGKVTDTAGDGLANVRVIAVGHPELGYTDTRPDGSYFLAANGGGQLRVRFEKQDHLPVERQVDVPWQDYTPVEDVAMTPLDPNPTQVDLSQSTPIQVAQGSAVTDSDGTRQATLLFAQGTTATMTLPGGATQPITDMTVRATEYTVGSRGPEAMPASLPPTSAYTYAAEYSVDEAIAAGASEVTFSAPVVSYLDNFLSFPTGTTIPSGYFDQAQGAWVPQESGRVVKVLSEAGGIAVLDVDGSGNPATPAQLANLGITDDERETVSDLYDPVQTLWRVRVTHFSPFDFNWPFDPPDDATAPDGVPKPGGLRQDQDCPEAGSIIECEDQVLGEQADVTGTDLSLNYRSDRTPGRRTGYEVEVPLTDSSPPASLKRVELEVDVAGRHFTQQFTDDPGQHHTFTWDARDAFGRMLQGTHSANVSIGYVYDANYTRSGRFAYTGDGFSISTARREWTIWRRHQVALGNWDARGQGLGGWTLSAHHVYDPNARVLYMGSGERRSATDVGRVIQETAGGGTQPGDGGPATAAKLFGPTKLAAAPDGSLYVSDYFHDRIRRISPDGTITTVAGAWSWTTAHNQGGFAGDEGPATAAYINGPKGIDLGPDGSLYVADLLNRRIRRVAPDGVITTVAGNGAGGNVPDTVGDGGPATAAELGDPSDVAAAPDGSLYIAGWGGVRRVDPEGQISTVYTRTGFPPPTHGIDAAPDGALLIVDGPRVRRLAPDGSVKTLAGTGEYGFTGDGGPATDAKLGPTGGDVEALADGSFYIADSANNRVRLVDPDGVISTIAGAASGYAGEGGPAGAALMNAPYGLALGPGQALYVADSANNRVRAISSQLPGFGGQDIAIASEDGAQLHRFDERGRHLETVSALTGATLWSFGYDPAGRLSSATDGDGNVTEVERDSQGTASAIVAPFGQRTELGLDHDGHLDSITNPEGEEFQAAYTSEGLLSSFTDPKSQTSDYSYDSNGRLTRADDRAAGFKTLARSELSNGYQAQLETKLARTTGYRVERLPTGDLRRTFTDPAGLDSELVIGTDGSREATAADGTQTTLTRGPDPRFGMDASILDSLTVATPGGLGPSATGARAVSLSNPGDPLSLQTQTDTLTVNGHTATTAYTAANRRFTSTSPEGRVTKADIDAQGRPTRDEVTNVNPVVSSYDSAGRLDDTQQGARSWDYAYEPGSGLLDTITDPLARVTSFDYDDAGRVTTETLPGNRTIAYSYDLNGNLTSVTPPSRPAHLFDANALDLITGYTPPDLGFSPRDTTYSYDDDRQLELVDRPGSGDVEFAHGSTTGRLDSFTTPSGTTALTYNPSTGNVATLTAPGPEQLSFSYDGSLPTQESLSGTVSGSASRTYDDDLRLASSSVNSGHTISYSYDDDGLLTGAGALTLTPDSDNGLLRQTTLDSVSTATDHNAFAEPDTLSATRSGNTLFAEALTRDDLGRIETKTETTSQGTHSYEYDYWPQGFLKQVRRDSVVVADYTYDPNGNRATRVAGGQTTTATTDAQDRLTAYGPNTYSYTQAGELLTKTNTLTSDTTTYSYDALGTLEHATLPNGDSLDYANDGYGRRIAKQRDGSLEQGFLYGSEAQGPVAELDDQGTLLSRFVYATRSNVPDYMTKSGNTYRIVTDDLGSPRTIVDASSGQVMQELDYDEFGNVVRDTNPGFQPFGFAGGLYDRDLKLVRFGARDYDPETGRWTARDPIGFSGGDTNLYGYVMSDPVNLVDPEGLWGVPSFVDASDAAAGTLNSFTFGLSNKIAGVDGSCAGGGYGFGSVLGELNPRGLANGLIRGGIKRFARDAERRAGRVAKSGSPVWQRAQPYRGPVKTNGRTGRQREYYEWDRTHGDIEVYDSRGRHIGTRDPVSGALIKPAVPGRSLDL